MKALSIFFSLLLTPLLVVMPLQAEMPASIPDTTAPSAQATTLRIRLADPGKSVVEANTSLQGYAIVVTDGSGLPVADAAVAIRLPEDGPTGFFTDGARSAVAYTNASGVARFAQVNWGSALGTVSVRVTAVKGELHAGAMIEQTITARSAAAAQTPSTAAAITPLPSNPIGTPASAAAPKLEPGTPASAASLQTGATPDKTSLETAQTAASSEPVVSVVNTGGSKASHSNKKWLILTAAAVGVGVGTALALSGKSATTLGGGAAVVGIGSPTVSIGH